MSSFLSKFVRGGAEAGAALFADQAREELRADIAAQRDKVLNDNRQKLQQDQQDFTAGQASQARAQQELDHKRTMTEPRAQADAITLTSKENMQALKADYAKAETDAQRSVIAKKMAAESGKPIENLPVKAGGGPTAAQKEARVLATLDEFENEAEALKFLKSKEGNMTKEIFKALVAKQDGLMLTEKDDGYQTFEEMLTQAREMARPEAQKEEPAEVVRPKLTDEDKATATKVGTQEEYDSLKVGTLFLNTTNNKYMWKQ